MYNKLINHQSKLFLCITWFFFGFVVVVVFLGGGGLLGVLFCQKLKRKSAKKKGNHAVITEQRSFEITFFSSSRENYGKFIYLPLYFTSILLDSFLHCFRYKTISANIIDILSSWRVVWQYIYRKPDVNYYINHIKTFNILIQIYIIYSN